MAILNAKEKELVNKYAANIRCALDSDYARAMPASVLQKFVEMFDKYTNNTTTLNYSCGQCQLNFLKRLGSWLRKNNIFD